MARGECFIPQLNTEVNCKALECNHPGAHVRCRLSSTRFILHNNQGGVSAHQVLTKLEAMGLQYCKLQGNHVPRLLKNLRFKYIALNEGLQG